MKIIYRELHVLKQQKNNLDSDLQQFLKVMAIFKKGIAVFNGNGSFHLERKNFTKNTKSEDLRGWRFA